jgi:uncharacterized membrane protein YeaQ/YmgE (transglycosylase-associated protein family)
MDPIKILIMVVVGAIAGTIAARIAKGKSYGILINALLGIAGAVVGGYLFNLLNINAGAGIVNIIYDTFGVQFPENIIGMIASGTVGALIILYVSKIFKK